jgi:hypothetical protein
MSTRGAIAVRKGKGWQGVYNHSDSYPTGLGPDVWQVIQESLKGQGLKSLCKEILRFDDWRNFRNGGVCLYCGKVGVGQAHSIGGGLYLAVNKDKNLFPDQECKNHQHSDLTSKVRNTSAKRDALWIEWVYVIDPEKNSLEIFVGSRDKGSHTEKRSDGTKYSEPNYKWAYVSSFRVDKEEPNWKAVEDFGNELRERSYEENSPKKETKRS